MNTRNAHSNLERVSKRRYLKDHKHLRRLEVELEAPVRKQQSKYLGGHDGPEKQERNQKMKLRRAERGEPPAPKRRKYRNFNSRVQRLKDALENNLIDIFLYWTKISLI